MNDQIQPLIDLLKGHFGWAAAVIAWMSAVRLALKPFSARIQTKLAAAMVDAAADPDDAKDWEAVLHKRWYRLTSFFLDLFCSFKLPTHVEFERLQAAGTGPNPPLSSQTGMGKTLGVLLVASLALGLLGCGGAKLETGGAYAPVGTNGVALIAPDMAFYIADAAYKTAWSAVDAAFNFERDNRAALWSISPEIKHTLDQIRPKAVEVNHDYLAARAAYLANPTPAGLTTLQTVLAKMQQLMGAAQAVLPKADGTASVGVIH